MAKLEAVKNYIREYLYTKNGFGCLGNFKPLY